MNKETAVQIILAQPRGFCAGVKRAIDIVELALSKYGEKRKICVFHEIVHNTHVINNFIQKGVMFVDQIADVPDGSVLIFSAHGVSERIENEAKARNLHIINATCPLVTKVHAEAQKREIQGLQVILIGHAGHPEVEGTSGRVQQSVILLQSENEVDNLRVIDSEKLAYVTQTTLSVDETSKIIAALKKRFPKIVGPDLRDICYATQNRQTAVRALTEIAEVILVVGSENSSNSNRLKDICVDKNIPVYLIDNYCDLNMSWLKEAKRIGITAGASAPDSVIQELVQFLEKTLNATTKNMEGRTERVIFGLPKELQGN